MNKPLFFSFLIHIFIFSFIVVTFPVPKESLKTHMVFLGSILKGQDIVIMSFKDTNRTTPTQLKDNALTFWPEKKTDPFTTFISKKPVLREPASSVSKTTLKSTFPVIFRKNNKTVSGTEKIDIPPRPYEPLRLYPND